MIRQNEFNSCSKKTILSFFYKSSVKKLVLFLTVLLLIGFAIFAITLVGSNVSKIKKIIPQKDPYHLLSVEEKREELYEKLASGTPSSKLYYELAETAFSAGEIPEAEYFIEKCDKSNNSVANLREKIQKFNKYRNRLESYLYEERNYFDSDLTYPTAYEIIDQILELCPEGLIHTRHLFLKGYLLLREGRRTEARVIFENLQRHGGALAPTALYLYAKTFMGDQDKTQGIEPFTKYIEENESARLFPLASVYLAQIYNSLGNPQKAIDVVDYAVQKSPNSEYLPELLLEKEKAYVLLKSDESIKILIEAFDKYPNSKPVFERAIAIYDDWASKKSYLNQHNLLLSVASVLIKNERYYQSKTLLDALLKLLKGKDRVTARYLLALRNQKAGDLDSALKECNNAVSAASENDQKCLIYTLMGNIYSNKKDVASAEKYYLKAVELKAGSSDSALREIAKTAYDNGWREKATQYYEKLVTEFPDSIYLSEALNYLVVINSYNGKTDLVSKYASMLIEKGARYEDRLRGEYYSWRVSRKNNEFYKNHPLAYYSFVVDRSDVAMFLEPEKAYPSVNSYKNNLAWEYFLAGCYDLAEKEYQFINDKSDPYAKMVLCYVGYYHKRFTDGIIRTRDFTDGNYQSLIEKGYMMRFYKKAFPLKYVDIIEKYAPQAGFPTSFILAIIRQESFFNPTARSSSNALGLMQILPSTGKWIAEKKNKSKEFEASKLTDPEFNIEYGIWYLEYLRDNVGSDLGMILAGHNGGPGNVKKWKTMFPVHNSDSILFYELIPSRQTREFVRHVLTNQRIYEKLYQMESENVYF